MSEVRCPVCGSPASVVIARHEIDAAARHFEVGYGYRDRGRKLRTALRDLWAPASAVEVRRCEDCGFGYAWPHKAGDAAFYNLVTGQEPEYPQARWEFGRTITALDHQSPAHHVLDAGAGDGAFLTMLRTRLGEDGARLTALEYDRGAIAALRSRGFDAIQGSVVGLAGDDSQQGRYDVVCLFQSLEHMDSETDVRDALLTLMAPGGHLFISVPNAPAIGAQERLTGFFDMPPNHVGRWSRPSIDAWVKDAALRVVEDDLEPLSAEDRAAHYANQRLMADRYSSWSFPSLAHRASHPVAIDVLTRRRRRRYEQLGNQLDAELPSPTYWAHLAATR